MIFDGLDFQTRIIKLRPKQSETCAMCKNLGAHLTEIQINDIIDKFNYEFFCGVSNYNDKTVDLNILNTEKQRITCNDYRKLNDGNKEYSHLMIDVRPSCQFDICSLPDSISKLIQL